MHNRSGIAPLDGAIEIVMAGMVPDQHVLSNGAPASTLAPSITGGCISELSSDSIHGVEHEYTSAMKNYGTIYEQYQSYLMPRNELLPHDYELSIKLAALSNSLGCLNEELLASTLHQDDVSDDDIENCGYMGWLHH